MPEPTAAGRPGIVVVSYNTRRLTAQLICSLYRTLRPPAFHLVVVDNGSTDGWAELLSAVAEAGLWTSSATRRTVTTDRVSTRGCRAWPSCTAAAPSRSPPSGCSTPTAWSSGRTRCRRRTPVMRETGAALVSQRGYDTSDEDELLGLHSLLLDPAQVWRPHPAVPGPRQPVRRHQPGPRLPVTARPSARARSPRHLRRPVELDADEPALVEGEAGAVQWANGAPHDL